MICATALAQLEILVLFGCFGTTRASGYDVNRLPSRKGAG
jgi:hypothetical protein